MSTANTASVKKIAICGLANAGKTTLIRTLQHKYHIGKVLLQLGALNAIKSLYLDKRLRFGISEGKSQYQKQYLANPDRYFSDLGFLFYVIDIQDSAHFADSLEYFQKFIIMPNP